MQRHFCYQQPAGRAGLVPTRILHYLHRFVQPVSIPAKSLITVTNMRFCAWTRACQATRGASPLLIAVGGSFPPRPVGSMRRSSRRELLRVTLQGADSNAVDFIKEVNTFGEIDALLEYFLITIDFYPGYL